MRDLWNNLTLHFVHSRTHPWAENDRELTNTSIVTDPQDPLQRYRESRNTLLTLSITSVPVLSPRILRHVGQTYLIFPKLIVGNTAKPVYNDHSRDQGIVFSVDRWSLYGAALVQLKWVMSQPAVISIHRWSSRQNSLLMFSTNDDVA